MFQGAEEDFQENNFTLDQMVPCCQRILAGAVKIVQLQS